MIFNGYLSSKTRNLCKSTIINLFFEWGNHRKRDHVEKTGFFRKPSKRITCSKKQVRYKIIDCKWKLAGGWTFAGNFSQKLVRVIHVLVDSCG